MDKRIRNGHCIGSKNISQVVGQMSRRLNVPYVTNKEGIVFTFGH